MNPRLFGLLVALWGGVVLVVGLLGRGPGCGPGACVACGLCLRRPPAVSAGESRRG